MSPIHIYHLNTQLFSYLDSDYFDCLKDADWLRVRALRHDTDQQARQLAYATAYWLLQAHTALSAAALEFEHDTFGKPFVPQLAVQPVWHINLSHSNRQITIAIAQTPVGVDIEAHQEIELQSIITHYFPNDPWRAGDLVSLYNLWVCKEALLKAQGIGLRIELKSVVLREPSSCFTHVLNGPAELSLEKYAYALVECPEHYSCAVAIYGSEPTLQTQTLDLTQLHALSKLTNP